MVAELLAEYGFSSMLVSFFAIGLITLWLFGAYPFVSCIAAIGGIAMVVQRWFSGEPTGLLDFPFFIMICHLIGALFFTREGWRLIAVMAATWVLLELLSKLRND